MLWKLFRVNGVFQLLFRLPMEKRFGEIHRDIADISPKMLSQELKSLETNKIITRTLFDTKPLTVEYSLTPLGLSTTKLLDELLNWGIHFRNEVVGK